jgi:hypothetical protein
MMNPTRWPVLLLAGALLTAGAVAVVQQPAPAQPPPSGAATPAGGLDEPRLMFEREIFDYQGGGRRDPFRALTGRDGLGPLFEDLTLRMIIFSEVRDQSIVVVADGANRAHRLRRGDVIGNARVLEIEPGRAIFTVEDLGVRRQEVLELRRNQQEGVR